MGFWNMLRWKVRQLFGIEHPLSEIIIDNVRKQQTQQSGHVPTPTPIARRCQYKPCRNSLKGLSYKCNYCGGRYCEEHRLPEDHDCDEPSLPESMRMGFGTKNSSAGRNRNAIGEKN